jgi:choline monooxygenase
MSKFYIDPIISRAKTIDTSFYLEPQILEASKEKIFAPSWQYIGHTGMIPNVGDTHPFKLLENYINEPLVLTRDTNNQVHCLSNVCTHRGNLMVYEPCSAQKHLRCKYHGRAFHLDGKFISMPEFSAVENFIPENNHLHALPLFKWGPLLFTQLTKGLGPELFFQEMQKRVGWLPIDELVFDAARSNDYYIKSNWALYCENYLEGFHIPFVHPGLNAFLDFKDYSTELFKYASLQLGIAKNEENCFDIPTGHPDAGKKIAAYYFWVFPNMMFNFYPWGLSLNIITPIDAGNTKVSFLSFVYDASKLSQGAGSGLDTVEQEDEEIVQHVQEGIRSRFYHYGRYATTREQGTHHFHSLLANFLQQ